MQRPYRFRLFAFLGVLTIVAASAACDLNDWSRIPNPLATPSSESTPLTPDPTPRALAATSLESTPVASARQRSPTPRALRVPTKETRKGLDAVDCGPGCDWDYEPAFSSVEWLERPSVSPDGLLSLKVRVGEDDVMTFPNQPGGGASNIALTNGRGRLYGAVIPPARPGVNWVPVPGQWIADTYQFRDRILTVAVRLDARAAGQRGLTLCLWTGGRGPANRVLDCIPVARP